MSGGIEAAADDLHIRITAAWSQLYRLEQEAKAIGLNDTAGKLFTASSYVNSAACTLHTGAPGTDLARLTAEQLAQAEQAGVRG